MMFRKEVIEHSNNRLDGDVLLIPRVSYILVTTLLVLWTFVVVFWLFISEYSSKETVKGWIEPVSGVVKIYTPLTEGRIVDIRVSEGEEVLAGDELMLLRNSKVLANGDEINEKLLFEFDNGKKILLEQLARVKESFPSQQRNLSLQLESVNKELIRLELQTKTVAKHETLVSKELVKYKRLLDLKMISIIEHNKVSKELLTAQSNRQLLERDRERLLNMRHKLLANIELLPINYEDDISALKGRIVELDQRLLEARSQHEIVIRAPVSGSISNLQAHIGQRISNEIPLLSVVPVNSEMRIILLIPIRASAFLNEGQVIDVRYNAFPYQKFGTYSAIVKGISNSVLLPSEIASLPTEINEAVYRVEAKLVSNQITAYGKKIKLRPDMTLEADIYLSKRSLVEWLFEPVLGLIRKQ